MYSSIRDLLDEWDIEGGLKIQSKNGSIAVILGATHLDNIDEEKAYGYMLLSSAGYCYRQSEHPANMKTFAYDRVHWKVWEEPPPPEMVPHYHAIYLTHGNGAKYTISKTLYHSDEQAKHCIDGRSQRKYIRLKTEDEPVMLEK